MERGYYKFLQGGEKNYIQNCNWIQDKKLLWIIKFNKYKCLGWARSAQSEARLKGMGRGLGIPPKKGKKFISAYKHSGFITNISDLLDNIWLISSQQPNHLPFYSDTVTNVTKCDKMSHHLSVGCHSNWQLLTDVRNLTDFVPQINTISL